jgi:hypothetical protein
MGKRISRCVELLEQDQAIYYDGPHSGYVLTHAQGRIDAGTWADYINVGMEHGCFDMTGLAEYMRGMVDAGPTRSGHRTPIAGHSEASAIRGRAHQKRKLPV